MMTTTATKTSRLLYRSASSRRRLAENYKAAIRRKLQGIVNADARAIKRKLNDDTLTATGFQVWIEKYFGDRQSATRRAVAGVFATLAKEAAKIAAAEIKTDPPKDRVSGFADGAANRFTNRWATGGAAQLQRVAADAEAAGEDFREVVSERVGQWGERRAGKAARRESHGIVNGIARIVFTAAGYSLIWVTAGDPCPFCDALNGARVGGAEAFVGSGKFDPAGANAPLKVRSPVLNPPLHDGCICSIVAG
jgi:hypothetical protein